MSFFFFLTFCGLIPVKAVQLNENELCIFPRSFSLSQVEGGVREIISSSVITSNI